MKNKEIEEYLNRKEVLGDLNLLALKYNYFPGELAQAILEGEASNKEAVDFLIEDLNFEEEKANDFIDALSENIIEPFYVDGDEDFEEEEEELEDESVSVPVNTIWKDFIKPKSLTKSMEELGRISSGDVSRIRNYLWKSLGLGKAEEVVVVLSWLARTGELVKTWQQDSRFKGILKKYIAVKYTDEIAETMIEAKPTPALLSLALEMVLVDKLKLSKEDSAMVVMAIIDNMLDEDKPKYILMAYVDAKDNSFNWNKLQTLGSSLQLAI
ncbi:MAG: hypothetical protein ACKKL6_03450 [Candidatus Komeilibacteria bacterium]